MCAPAKDIAKTALIGAAVYATGGAALSSVLATSGGSMAAAATTTATTTSTLQTLYNAARIGLPIISTAGNIYQGYLQSQILKQKANFVNYEIATEAEAFALRKWKKKREMRQALDKQRALYGLTGATIEGSPTDVLEGTAADFAENIYVDAFNTSQKIIGKKQQQQILEQESQYAVLGGFVNAATVLGTRGFMDRGPKTTTTNTGRDSLLTKLGGIRTATEGSS